MVSVTPPDPPRRGLRFDGRITVGNVLVLLGMVAGMTAALIKATNMYDDIDYNQKIQSQQIASIQKDVTWLTKAIASRSQYGSR